MLFASAHPDRLLAFGDGVEAAHRSSLVERQPGSSLWRAPDAPLLTPSFLKSRPFGKAVGSDQALFLQQRVQSILCRSCHDLLGLPKFAGPDFKLAGDPAVRLVGVMIEDTPYGLTSHAPSLSS